MNLKKRKNKKGWVKMLEVFISIMLLTGAVVLFLNQNTFTGNTERNINEKIEHILMNIQWDEDLRGEILGASLPVEWADFNSSGLTNTGLKIYEKTPPNLVCEGMVCSLSDDCLNAGSPGNKDIYSKVAYISADLDTYNPRQLKVFCWKK